MRAQSSHDAVERGCSAKFCFDNIYKFAGDATVLGWISNNYDREYRKEIDSFVTWCENY